MGAFFRERSERARYPRLFPVMSGYVGFLRFELRRDPFFGAEYIPRSLSLHI